MTAGPYDFEIETKASFRLPMNWKDENGDTIDLSLHSAQMQIRDFLKSDTVIIELSTANGKITLSDTDPNILWEIDSADTKDLNSGEKVWDMFITDPLGFVVKLLKGDCCIDPHVTR